MAGALASGAGGIIGGVVGPLVSASAQKKIAKKNRRMVIGLHEEGAATRQMVSDKVEGAVGLAEQNLLRGETARANVYASLGQPGSYDMPSQTPGPISFEGLRPTGLGFVRPGEPGSQGSALTGDRYRDVGIVTGRDVAMGRKARFKGTRPWEIEGELLDPKKMADKVKGSAGYRTVSGMVAKAEQLASQRGPFWEQMNNSIVGSIYESNAAFERQAMEKMSRSIARGGSARRTGLLLAQAFQIQENVNRARTGQLWQAKLQLEKYTTEYAQNVTGFAQAWVNNAAGIRDGFTNALQNLQLFWASTLSPTLAGATVDTQSATQQGILDASEGLMKAAQTKGDAISGGIQALVGVGQKLAASYSIDDSNLNYGATSAAGVVG